MASQATTELATVEQVVVQGDLSKLTPPQRLEYYSKVCQSTGLNPMTRPFDYIMLNGKLTLYAKKDAADQLRKLNGISIVDLKITYPDDTVEVTAFAATNDGRRDSDVGIVVLGTTKGETRANLIMKAITKAKRRVTLSISGLGWLDETEVDSIPSASPVLIDHATGEVVKPRRLPAPQVTEDFQDRLNTLLAEFPLEKIMEANKGDMPTTLEQIADVYEWLKAQSVPFDLESITPLDPNN